MAVCLGAVACGSTPVAPPPPPPPVITPPPPPPPPPPAPTLKITKIMAFGDSQTEGCRTQSLWLADPTGCPEKAGQSYPAKLLAMLRETYYDQPDIQVINAGKGGEVVLGNPETTAVARPRFNELLQSHNPQLVILMHGTNDLGLEANARRDIVDAMEDMIRDAQAANVTMFLSELPRMLPGVGNPPKGDAAERVPAYNADLAQLANRRDVELVRIFDHITDSMISTLDGLHLTQAGNQRLAELYYDAIKAKYHVPAPTTAAR